VGHPRGGGGTHPKDRVWDTLGDGSETPWWNRGDEGVEYRIDGTGGVGGSGTVEWCLNSRLYSRLKSRL